MIRNERVTSPRFFAAAGAVLAIISAFLPWFEIASLNEVRSITPATESYLRPSAWLVCFVLLVGAVVVFVKGMPLVVGCAGALWFNVALISWMLGSKGSSILPKEVLPENFTVHLQFGADLGLGAGVLILMSSLMLLADKTWHGDQERVRGWSVPIGILVAVTLISVREVPWMHLNAIDFGWELTVDAVPFLGDLIVIALIIGAFLSVATAFTERLWLTIACIAGGVIVAVLGTLGLLLEDTLIDVGSWASERATFLQGQNLALDSSSGAYFTIGAGLALSAYGAGLMLHRAQRGEGLGFKRLSAAAEPVMSSSSFDDDPDMPF